MYEHVEDHGTYPKGPCTQIVYTLGFKVLPIWVHWAQSIYDLGFMDFGLVSKVIGTITGAILKIFWLLNPIIVEERVKDWGLRLSGFKALRGPGFKA